MLELIGKKIGMSHLFGEDGVASPLTFIKLYDNCVIDLKVNADKDFDDLTLAFEQTENAKKLNKAQIGFFNKKSIPLHKKIKQCRVKKGAAYKTNDKIEIDVVFKEGDLVDVRGVTIGKGFAGVMKRHNFAGLEASHGVSVSHRSHGSTGQRQDPGKVFKGKKMAGHMGVDNITTKNLQILVVDKEKSLIGVKGAVPGFAGGDVIIKIAKI
ncbi:MAG TPA: 50S ribosomal protein L3 [Rickettsiales bacterium]|nr:50S ribosomal protein L3 [Rickettsiales bacterium]